MSLWRMTMGDFSKLVGDPCPEAWSCLPHKAASVNGSLHGATGSHVRGSNPQTDFSVKTVENVLLEALKTWSIQHPLVALPVSQVSGAKQGAQNEIFVPDIPADVQGSFSCRHPGSQLPPGPLSPRTSILVQISMTWRHTSVRKLQADSSVSWVRLAALQPPLNARSKDLMARTARQLRCPARLELKRSPWFQPLFADVALWRSTTSHTRPRTLAIKRASSHIAQSSWNRKSENLKTVDTEIKVKLIPWKYYFAFAFVLISIGQMIFRVYFNIDTSPRISLSLSLS